MEMKLRHENTFFQMNWNYCITLENQDCFSFEWKIPKLFSYPGQNKFICKKKEVTN